MSDTEWAEAQRVPKAEVVRLLGRPPLPDEEKKQRVTMYLDRDIIAKLKQGGKGWTTRANQKLREALGLNSA